MDRAQRVIALILGIAAAALAVCVGLRYAYADRGRTPILQKADLSRPLYEPARLDLNAASAEELSSLPGIGPVLAGRIVDRREEYGPFETVEDVLAVYGIGAATYEKIAPYITY